MAVEIPMTRSGYVAKYQQLVLSVTKGTGLFPSLMLGQAILESSDVHGRPGFSTLARKYNNHFGIKANATWLGQKASLITKEVFNGKTIVKYDYFRAYGTVDESFKDRVQFIISNSRYRRNGVFQAKTIEEQANAFAAAGYATDPKYASKLLNLVYSLGLRSLDTRFSPVL